MDGPLNKMREEVQPKKRKMEVTKPIETFRLSAGGVAQISDMQILLLGYRNAGRSSSGNTILGKEEFDTSGRTAESVKREGETADRHVTVVEAPGWCEDYTIDCTTKRDKREIVLSVTLCQPGPHVILLVIRVDTPFNETHRRSVQEHLELLGERVWNHTILLFSCGDWLGDTNIEQHIESEGEALQWVVEKCGNRYHVVDNKKSDGGQVTGLLEKIEEMVAGNSDSLFHVDQINLKKQLEKKRKKDRRAEERRIKVQKRRETLRSSTGFATSLYARRRARWEKVSEESAGTQRDPSSSRPSDGGVVAQISDMRILLLGYRNAGRSSSGNTILGKEEFDTSGRTAESVKREGETADRHVTVVEAPGWCEDYTIDCTTECDKREIVLSVTLCPPGPHAILLVIRVDTRFNETHRRALQDHLELLGESVWSHTIVLFTFGDWLGGTNIEKHIESEGEALQWVVEKCGNRYHVVDNTHEKADEVTELLEQIKEMVALNSGYFKGTQRKEERSKGSKDQPPKMSDSGYLSRDSWHCSQHPVVNLDPVVNLRIPKAAFMRRISFVNEDDIKFDSTKFIGGGSFGSVYKGSYQGMPVAVKNIRMGHCPVKSLELVIPLRLSHPHIVKMIAASKNETEISIAYQYIHGANLQEIIHSQCKIKLNEQDKMRVALEIGTAVEYIHERDIIHQDIKPANILVSEGSKRAYLTDWGLANIRDSRGELGIAASGLWSGPLGAGIPMYIPPEHLGNTRCTTMSDMWSLGLTYLEMFTGSVPWYMNFKACKALYDQERPDAMAELQPHLKKFVEPLLQYEPQSRMSATDLVKSLKSKVDLVTDYGYEQ